MRDLRFEVGYAGGGGVACGLGDRGWFRSGWGVVVTAAGAGSTGMPRVVGAGEGNVWPGVSAWLWLTSWSMVHTV
jgi:hypothetical protein